MKKTGIIVLGLIGVILLLLGISLISGYNGLVTADEEIAAKYSQIEVRLQERHDKIGMIVNAVNGLQDHAETIYNMITEARAAYAAAAASGNQEQMIQADALEALALTSLIAVVEDNPDITAEVGYYALIDEIASIEAALAVARRDYNTAIQTYNTDVRRFPKVLYASLFGFQTSYEYWKMNAGADEVPDVVFE